MKETGMWGHTPYVCYGQKSHQVCLFLHGQSGNKEEGERFAQIANPGQRQGGAEPFLPWVVVPELEQVWQELQGRWSRIALRANSIGAWLSMLALAGKPVDTCLFVSPVVDMENLIQTMMTWAGVTEERLEREREIATDFGQGLSDLRPPAPRPRPQRPHPHPLRRPGQPGAPAGGGALRPGGGCPPDRLPGRRALVPHAGAGGRDGAVGGAVPALIGKNVWIFLRKYCNPDQNHV